MIYVYHFTVVTYLSLISTNYMYFLFLLSCTLTSLFPISFHILRVTLSNKSYLIVLFLAQHHMGFIVSSPLFLSHLIASHRPIHPLSRTPYPFTLLLHTFLTLFDSLSSSAPLTWTNLNILLINFLTFSS